RPRFPIAPVCSWAGPRTRPGAAQSISSPGDSGSPVTFVHQSRHVVCCLVVDGLKRLGGVNLNEVGRLFSEADIGLPAATQILDRGLVFARIEHFGRR